MPAPNETVTPAMVEAAARVMWVADKQAMNGWDATDDYERDRFRRHISVALTAALATGRPAGVVDEDEQYDMGNALDRLAAGIAWARREGETAGMMVAEYELTVIDFMHLHEAFTRAARGTR